MSNHRARLRAGEGVRRIRLSLADHLAHKQPLARVSARIGYAVERKELNLSQSLGSLGIDDNEPSLTSEEKAATVRELLQSRSGVYHAALHETRAAAAARPARHSHKPGTFWYYNNWDFNTLGTIYERAVRSCIFDAFEREIARPIGMEGYHPTDGRYVTGMASVYPAYPSKDERAILPALRCSTFTRVAGKTGRSFRRLGWRRVQEPTWATV